MRSTGLKIKAWLLVSTLDIVVACIQYLLHTGRSPVNVLRFIASGVFGAEAFSGGAEMVVAGIVFHFLIAAVFTFVFFWIVPKIAFLNHRWFLTGILYGIFVWSVMNLMVLPLSNTPPLLLRASNIIQSALILVCCIGLPLSYIYFKSLRETAVA